MLFNSITFIVFLALVFLLFWTINPKSAKAGKMFLLLSSYIFYGWWDWRFLLLIFISSLSDFVIGKVLYKQNEQLKRKFLLVLSIFINIGILCFFKYFNFFIQSAQNIFGVTNETTWSTLTIILPVGISFYTFQTLSYTIDIYRGKLVPTKSALSFFTFVAFFPQLVAGPIERASRLIPQFERKIIFEYSKANDGLKLILWGLFKKMVIADQIAVVVNSIFENPENFNGVGILVTIFLFGFQIYCDFSGYSDIAIGTAKLFGINLMDNFKTPFFARSLTEFWKRWHISLSSWFRDYLYIPLGGNRNGALIWSRNILLTFTISGLWHGAKITFVLWGLVHGVFYILEKYISPILKINKNLKGALGWLLTFIFVNISWILFRAESLQQLKILVQQITNNFWGEVGSLSEILARHPNFIEPARVLLFIFPVFIIFEKLLKQNSFAEYINSKNKIVAYSTFYILILLILFFGVLNSAPQFIYFQF